MWRFFIALFLLGALPGSGLIFWNAEDPPANKETAPNGDYANSGWQHLIRFKNFQGIMISPKHFITAKHLGDGVTITRPSYFSGGPEETFTIKPDSRVVIEDGSISTDLSIFEIWETFPSYAPLYSDTNEAGKEFVITGKGRGRGTELTRNSQVVGWEWGDIPTEADRWGVSNVLSTSRASSGADLIYSQFDANGGPFECQATGNDSGGGWFIKDGAVWKLAAVTFSADANRDSNNTVGDNSHFRAAMTKARGFYIGSDTDGWNLIPTSRRQYLNPPSYETNDNDARFYDKTHSYGTRISSYLSKINPLIQPSINHAALNPSDRFLAWLSNHGLTVNNLPGNDADQDGISNLLEYYSDSDAGDFSEVTSPFSASLQSNGEMQFTLTESLDLSGRGLTSVIQKSNDLENWSDLTTVNEESISLDLASGTRVRILSHSTGSATKIFFRLKVTLAN
jgi:hypothetical protein